MNTIRARRRNRWRQKAKLGMLDAIALNKIHDSYLHCSSTWGGTRCADCGLAVRPQHLISFVLAGPGFRAYGSYTHCGEVGNCTGGREGWEELAIIA